MTNTPSRHGSLLTEDAHTRKRNKAEARFKAYWLTAICVSVLALVMLVTSILGSGL
jgi:phosphate transport system permease protein